MADGQFATAEPCAQETHAEINFGRCRDCGAAIVPATSGSGRPRVRCIDCSPPRITGRKVRSKTCEQCGKEFDCNHRNRKTYSPECYRKLFYSAQRYRHQCVECGRSFQSGQFRAKCCESCLSGYLSRRSREHFDANPHLRKWSSKQDMDRFYAFRRRRIVRGRQAEVFSAAEIFERDGWLCQLCGEEVDRDLKWPDPKSASLDHVVQIARGGQHIRSNCQLAHLGCNSRKGAGLPVQPDHAETWPPAL